MRSGDWTAVEKALYEETKDVAESLRIYRPRFALSGTTLTVSENVMGRSGDQADFARSLTDVLGGKAESTTPEPSRPAKRALGRLLNCDHDYADVATWSDDRTYATGALVFTTFAAEPTTLYKCVSRSGCTKDDSLLGPHWALVGHC